MTLRAMLTLLRNNQNWLGGFAALLIAASLIGGFTFDAKSAQRPPLIELLPIEDPSGKALANFHAALLSLPRDETTPLTFLPTTVTATQLPKSIRQQLNRKYYAWKLPLIEQEIHQFLKQRRARPEFISGDFDGDGLKDYAVFIVYGQPEARKTRVIAFMRREAGWKTHRLETNLADDESLPSIKFLALAKKGTRDYDYQRDRKFTYRHDAIFSGYFAKAGVSYVYRKGRFRQIVTSD